MRGRSSQSDLTEQYGCPTIIGTYVNGRRLPLQGRGWGFESLRAYHRQYANETSVCRPEERQI